MHIANVSDRKELQVLALIKAETAAMKKKANTSLVKGSTILAQAPHLAWQG